MQSYQELVVWQKAMEAAKLVYSLVKKLPKEETYSMSDQMRRAAVSVPSNIAEGHARSSRNEYQHFLSVAKGSAAELETQLLLCVKIDYLADKDISLAMALLQEVGKMLNAIKKSWQQKDQGLGVSE
jgi:four helix bundle protein